MSDGIAMRWVIDDTITGWLASDDSTWDSEAEAQAHIDAVRNGNSRSTLEQVFGPGGADPWKPALKQCYTYEYSDKVFQPVGYTIARIDHLT